MYDRVGINRGVSVLFPMGEFITAINSDGIALHVLVTG